MVERRYNSICEREISSRLYLVPDDLARMCQVRFPVAREDPSADIGLVDTRATAALCFQNGMLLGGGKKISPPSEGSCLWRGEICWRRGAWLSDCQGALDNATDLPMSILTSHFSCHRFVVIFGS